ncbi:MAG: hypothetical protein KBA91_03665 [Candidatus Moranbacteria bacterium]|nr:hypothetical protein [Candidatus Moranbacteria bacterium]
MDTKEIIMSHKRPAAQASPSQPTTTTQITLAIISSLENSAAIAAAQPHPDNPHRRSNC